MVSIAMIFLVLETKNPPHSFQNLKISSKTSNDSELEKKAVEEIMKETSRAAVRAEVGGSLSWRKPKHKGVNKRFLNNTMLSTMIQNKKTAKQSMDISVSNPLLKNTAEDQNLLTKSPVITKIRNQIQPSNKTGGAINNKGVLSSKGRYKAYLASYKKQMERDNEESKNKTDSDMT